MKVRFMVAIASEEWSYRPGETAWLDAVQAEKFIAGKIAVAVPDVDADEPEAK